MEHLKERKAFSLLVLGWSRGNQTVKVDKDGMVKIEFVPCPRRQHKILGSRADMAGERKTD